MLFQPLCLNRVRGFCRTISLQVRKNVLPLHVPSWDCLERFWSLFWKSFKELPGEFKCWITELLTWLMEKASHKKICSQSYLQLASCGLAFIWFWWNYALNSPHVRPMLKNISVFLWGSGTSKCVSLAWRREPLNHNLVMECWEEYRS
jgi:hypothetical protein